MTYSAREPAGMITMGAPPAAGALLGPARATRDPETAAREFAGLFYSMMIREMRKNVPENPYFGGACEKTFRSMWTSEMGRALAYRRDDALVRAILSALKEGAAAPQRITSAGGQV